jgi:hypothetical protein
MKKLNEEKCFKTNKPFEDTMGSLLKKMPKHRPLMPLTWEEATKTLPDYLYLNGTKFVNKKTKKEETISDVIAVPTSDANYYNFILLAKRMK